MRYLAFILLFLPFFPLFAADQSKNDWWKSAVFYQIYTRSFVDANGDGIGDFPGIISKLDYLKSNGVDAIWISPLHPSPLNDYGYDISDYYSVDPDFGSLQEFKALIAACNDRHIAVVMDLVVNHTSDQHPWFKESSSSLDNPKRDWYLWRRASFPSGGVPNNWRSRFGLNGSAWAWSEASTRYYHHSFLPSQPDLNWRNPEVRAEIKRIMEYWLALGVKGFRLDVCNYYLKDADFRDNPTRSKWNLFAPHTSTRSFGQWMDQVQQSLFYDYAKQVHVYDKDQPDVLDILQEFRATVAPYNGVLIGEVDSEEGARKSAFYYGPQGEALHLAFNPEQLEIPWNAREFFRTFQRWQQLVPADGWPTIAFSNHDKVRSITRYGNNEAKAKILLALMMTMRGSPVLYYGEEIGMPEGKIAVPNIKDPAYYAAKLPGPLASLSWQGRDGCRTPLPWTSAPSGGFSLSAPWLTVEPREVGSVNVCDAEKDPHSLLQKFRQLSALRKSSPALTGGSIEFLPEYLDQGILAYTRTAGSEELLIVLNFSPGEQPFPFEDAETWEVVWGGDLDVTWEMGSSEIAHSLAPYAAMVLKKSAATFISP